MRINYDMLKGFVSDGCKDYVLPTLCNYAFPPCDSSRSKAKPRKFCRDDCLVLKNDMCKLDFERARKITFVSTLLPDCSSMPAVGDPDYKSCIRVVSQGKSRSLRAHPFTHNSAKLKFLSVIPQKIEKQALPGYQLLGSAHRIKDRTTLSSIRNSTT